VVTATYNAVDVLPRLIRSLRAQTDRDFEWVVADGASTDETLLLLQEADSDLRIRVDSRPDFGIYDALNRAVKMASGDYYLVVGADDELFPDAVARYKAACSRSDADLVTARIQVDGRVYGVRKRRWEWLHGQFAYVSGHAVGVAIRRDLHTRVGWYSRVYPVAADQYFVLSALHMGAQVSVGDFCAGIFYKTGSSGSDLLSSLTDLCRVLVNLGHSLPLQLLLLNLRVLRYCLLPRPRRINTACSSPDILRRR
jgi:glycosyltransferase involved in cell wall biosynthesis